MSSQRVLRAPMLDGQRRLLGELPVPGPTPQRQPVAASSPTPSTPPATPQFDAGHAEGLRQGLAEAQARIEREIEQRLKNLQAQVDQAEKRRQEEHGQRIAALDQLLQTVQKALPERFMALEREAIELAYEALCRVCGPHAEQHAGAGRAGLLADILRQGVHQLRGQPWLGVRLHPRDHGALTASDAGRALLERHPELRVQVDPTLEPLGAVIESDHGQLDVSLGTQLARLKDLWSHAGRADTLDGGNS
jgi:flagellar assembly protein FliH